MSAIRERAIAWYQTLGTLNAAVSEPVGNLADVVPVPILAAVIFGLLGATSPCQLTTGAGALVYVTRSGTTTGALGQHTLAYVLGKTLVYTLLGGAVLVLGQAAAPRAIPVAIIARQALGPMLLLLGLYLVGAIQLRLSPGSRIAEALRRRAGAGAGGTFALGMAFGLAFCPTLFLLFFGLTIPLALQSPVGLLYPPAFALGTMLPLLLLSSAIGIGAIASGRVLLRARGAGRWLNRVAGAVLMLAGLSDTFTYWLL